jgi:hypothetical protein
MIQTIGIIVNFTKIVVLVMGSRRGEVWHCLICWLIIKYSFVLFKFVEGMHSIKQLNIQL